jgi:hypothetical protein
VQKFVESGMGLMYQDPEYDKYTFEHEADSDCLKRLDICKAICCKFPFALSRQDVEEGIVRWEFRSYSAFLDSLHYRMSYTNQAQGSAFKRERCVP